MRERHGDGAEGLRLMMQGGLIVLDMYDQVELGVSGCLEGFLWQCRASSVTR
jgi:hypothetical protein